MKTFSKYRLGKFEIIVTITHFIITHITHTFYKKLHFNLPPITKGFHNFFANISRFSEKLLFQNL